MGVVRTRLGAIGYAEEGEGGIPLVLLHGVGCDKNVWGPQLQHFAGERRTVAFDYPGYGQSDLLPGATRDGFAAAILAAMDGLGIGRAHLCGLSLGGVVALSMHAAEAERCASLILADSFAVHPEGPAIYQRSVEAAEAMGMRHLAEERVDALLAPGANEHLRNEVVEAMAAIDPAAYALGAEAVWLADQRERARAVQCATLVLCGTEDRITPPALSEGLKDLIPHAALVEIAAAGHLSSAEQPAIFNRVVGAFLESIDPPG